MGKGKLTGVSYIERGPKESGLKGKVWAAQDDFAAAGMFAKSQTDAAAKNPLVAAKTPAISDETRANLKKQIADLEGRQIAEFKTDRAKVIVKYHIMLGTRSGLAVRFEEDNVRAMGRPAAGVIGVRFKRDGDAVVDMIVVPEGANTGQVLTGCVNGYGKRTPLEDYPLKGRGTQGVINIDATDRNGEVVGMKLVSAEDEVMMITEKGILIRTKVGEIRETGRNAAGVRLIKVDEGDKLVAMARVEAEDEPDSPAEKLADKPPEKPAE